MSEISTYWPMVVLLIFLEAVVLWQAHMIGSMRNLPRDLLAADRRLRAIRERRDRLAWRTILEERAKSPFRTDAETAFLVRWAEGLGATPEEARAALIKMDERDASIPSKGRRLIIEKAGYRPTEGGPTTPLGRPPNQGTSVAPPKP